MKRVQGWMDKKKSPLHPLQQHIQALNHLTAQVNAYLPLEWHAACQIVRFDLTEQCLVLSTTEQSLLTPLRYLQPQLLAQLKTQEKFAHLKSIQCIFTATHTARPISRPRTPAAAQAAGSCQAAAAQCPPELKASLERLSATLKTKE